MLARLPASSGPSAGGSSSSERTIRMFAPLLLAGALALTYASTGHDKRTISSNCENAPPAKALTANFVADAVEAVAPAVVHVNALFESPYFGVGIGSGSGFIITEDGFVVTNAHVVKMAGIDKHPRVLVTLMDGTKREASVHSVDEQSDIALLKMDNARSGEKFPIVTMGKSSKIRQGEFVVALGSPVGLQSSASFGIVSKGSRHASEMGGRSRAEWIQTDASINSGNSGGPLVNVAGEVIGVNSMKLANGEGVAFAIPVDVVKTVIKQLMQNGRVIRPYVGMRVVDFIPGTDAPTDGRTTWWGGKAKPSPHHSKLEDVIFNLKPPMVLVEKVAPGSPAEKCGIKGTWFFAACCMLYDENPV